MNGVSTEMGLQAGGMVDEAPWEAELLCDVGSKGLDAEGFGRVMTGVEEIHAEFFSQRVSVVRAFAAEESVTTEFGGLGDFRARSTAANANFSNAFGATWRDVDASA